MLALVDVDALRRRLLEAASRDLAAPEASDILEAAVLLELFAPRWRPFSTAPRGADVLAANASRGTWTRATVFEDGAALVHGGAWQPTHWRPMLPLPVKP